MKDELDHIPRALLFALLNNPYESLILIDAEGIVRFVSESNETIRKGTFQSAVGKHISEVNPDSDLVRIIQTGRAEIGHSLVLNDRERIVARIPLTRGGRVVGAAGKLLLSSPRKVKALYRRIESLEKQLDYYKSEARQVHGTSYSFDSIVGRSAKMEAAKSLAAMAAENDSPVIISGESGTGKEVFAHAIHAASRRRRAPFVRINCGAVPAELIESELFGYEPGAFTGARRGGGTGKIELAHDGTLFLDEVGEMPLRMQVKLLRVLQDKVVERIGGGKPRRINFRLVSATNQDLESMIRQGAFRLDLFYRINVMTIHLPPLKGIAEDIPIIFEAMLDDLSAQSRRGRKLVSADALNALMEYPWPGNIRELRNVAERALVVCEGERIEIDHLPAALRAKGRREAPAGGDVAKPLNKIMTDTERQAISDALSRSGNNRAKAARLLGIHRTGLYQKMKKYKMI
jgi:transcriptional regulator with PAS, ATPase and Fis domain